MTVDPDDTVIDLGVRPRSGEQPAAGDPPPARARIRWRPWLVMTCLAAVLVLLPGSTVLPASRGAAADPLPTSSSAPNLTQLNQLDEGYRMYQHGPVRPHQGPIQWCWIEQPQTGEMSLVPCAETLRSPPADR
jgi:hypothetical protein